MMLREEIKHISSTKKDLRSFGLTVGTVLCIIGGALYWFGKSAYLYFIAPGAALMLLGLVSPAILKPLQKAWMTIAVILGWFMTRLILGLLFFIGFTSIRLLGKLFGKEFMDIKWNPAAKSHWNYREDVPIDKTRYEQQF